MRAAGSRGWLTGIRAYFAKIRTVLLLSYFIIILLCITLVGTVSFYISYTSMEQRVESANFQIVRQIEMNMDNDFHSKRNLLLAPYFDEEYIKGINAYAGMSEEAKFLYRQKLGDLFLKSFNVTPIRDFIRFQIYYGNGELLSASDNRRPWTAAQVRSADWFRKTVEKNGQAYFSAVTAAGQQNAGDAAFASSIMIRDFSNPKSFVVVRAEYGDDLLAGIGSRDDLSERSRIYIYDEENRLVYRSEDGTEEIGAELPGRLTDKNGKFWIGEGGRSQFVSYTRSDYSGWKAALVMPREEIFGPLDRIKTAAIGTALLAFAVTFLISLLFGRSITKPILKLYKTVNRIKRGDFSIRVDVDRNDEIGLIASNFNAMQDELQKLIESKYLYQIKLQEMELAMLHSQINPHFLYNTLDSIRSMADYYDVRDIGEMAQSLADMFRYNIKNRDDIVTLQEELVQIEAYLRIQNIRFDGKIACEMQIEEELYGYPMLKMTLQPLVENAVFHGIERKRGQGHVRISAVREGDRMRLTVRDDGVGISERRLAELRAGLRPAAAAEEAPPSALSGSGIGLRNVYARYAIRFGDRFDLVIDSKKGAGTSVTLLFPDSEAEAGQ